MHKTTALHPQHRLTLPPHTGSYSNKVLTGASGLLGNQTNTFILQLYHQDDLVADLRFRRV